jgi:RimJ/RimL family protein N-acetyltransferase
MIDLGLSVRLKSIDEIPLSQLRQWRNDYRVWKWCRQNDVISHFAQNQWKEKLQSDSSIRMYSIFDVNDQGIGACGFTSIDMLNRRAEFSLYIDPEKQGKGYGRDALFTLISHGFMNLGFNSIWGESFEGNPAMRMFKELGFMHEGIKREAYFREGKFIDAHLFSVLHSEWIKKHLLQ